MKMTTKYENMKDLFIELIVCLLTNGQTSIE